MLRSVVLIFSDSRSSRLFSWAVTRVYGHSILGLEVLDVLRVRGKGLKELKAQTAGQVLVLGRSTYAHLPKALFSKISSKIAKSWGMF